MDFNNLSGSLSSINATIEARNQLMKIPQLDMKPGWHQVIILGNGFDLSCTLKSSFSDFFQNRKERLYPSIEEMQESDYDSWGEYVNAQGISVWDYILEEHQSKFWCDIEAAIGKWIVFSKDPIAKKSPYQTDKSRTKPIDRVFSLLENSYNSNIPFESRARINWEPYNPATRKPEKEFAIASYVLDNNGGEQKGWSKEKLLKYFYVELNRLEKEFANYLSAQISENQNYLSNSLALSRKIIAESSPIKDEYKILTSILNFNYTQPALERVFGTEIEHANIHGKLEKEIVFGMDGKDFMEEDLVVPFTKTYRLLGLRTAENLRIFESVGSFNKKGPIDMIKVFGHSLGKPDYSYFQALFDSVNLYGSSVQLVFYYRQYDNTIDLRENAFSAVTKLLTAYGNTMDNTNHGKNLMHKLLLESRLSIREIVFDV